MTVINKPPRTISETNWKKSTSSETYYVGSMGHVTVEVEKITTRSDGKYEVRFIIGNQSFSAQMMQELKDLLKDIAP